MIYPDSVMTLAKTPIDYTRSPYPSHNGGYEYVLGYEQCRKSAAALLVSHGFDRLLPIISASEVPAKAKKSTGCYIEGFNDCLKKLCANYTRYQ